MKKEIAPCMLLFIQQEHQTGSARIPTHADAHVIVKLRPSATNSINKLGYVLVFHTFIFFPFEISPTSLAATALISPCL